jgi:NADH-quinone oxidoreductase subunit A
MRAPGRCGLFRRTGERPRPELAVQRDRRQCHHDLDVATCAGSLQDGKCRAHRIAGALLVAPFLLAFKAPDPEKLSAYECGFNPFNDSRMKFDVRFYLVSLLFIVFDLEVAFLVPWAVAMRDVGMLGFWAMMIFLGVLTIGLIFEWKKGALDWE